MKKQDAQPTLPGITVPKGPVQITIRFGPDASKIIRTKLGRLKDLAPDVRITETDIVRGLLKSKLAELSHELEIETPPDFDTYH